MLVCFASTTPFFSTISVNVSIAAQISDSWSAILSRVWRNLRSKGVPVSVIVEWAKPGPKKVIPESPPLRKVGWFLYLHDRAVFRCVQRCWCSRGAEEPSEVKDVVNTTI